MERSLQKRKPCTGTLRETVLELTPFPLNGALPLIREPGGSLGIVASEDTGGLLRHTLYRVFGSSPLSCLLLLTPVL
jgi:hypothetical protein